ncbi:hypothetical protein CAEBREN_01270 [Caenorhabditis brenneri]|uniref:Uncharacterized protein n=1 Tax=Caenorhabditis brenneri TaxID=135651 RepID=G0P7K6_CAEBE|nr:hypothetical protein CAEBREN_01270 [Caenorhabditis brenneri]
MQFYVTNVRDGVDTRMVAMRIRAGSIITIVKHQNNLVVGPGNSTIVQNDCYTFFDQATPPKRWTYCFCNTADYCNASTDNSIFLPLAMFIVLFIFM